MDVLEQAKNAEDVIIFFRGPVPDDKKEQAGGIILRGDPLNLVLNICEGMRTMPAIRSVIAVALSTFLADETFLKQPRQKHESSQG